ncbi:transketolase [Shumkonia mesophila]|uniref:transketolase n=1 Tax=Shumkonia mesophila TaxID=2838854 RepID=UPI0029346254|nr:transketolase [Shumkonia mesophila]
MTSMQTLKASDAAHAPHKDMANAIRFLAADAVQKAKSGHPGMPMGMADVATVLFTRFLKFDPTAPRWADRDRFVLSAGHGSMLLYALLYLTGYKDVTIDEIKNFRQLDSKTPGHPEYGHTEGVEATTGPLGQGLAMAVGMALAERMRNTRYGDDLVDHYTYVIAGDGCLMEGISHEAIGFAGHLKLSKLIVLWDDNSISIDGSTDLARTEDQLVRFAAAGWATQAVDGFDPEAVAAAIEKAHKSDKPTIIGCKTVIGRGAPTKQGTAASHGAPLGDDEISGARATLGWSYPPFVVPENVLAAWRAAGARGATARKQWEGRLAATAAELRSEFERSEAGRLPEGWQQASAQHRKALVAEKPALATRQASGAALEVLTAAIPELIGGSADLTGSVNTKTKSTQSIDTGDFSGRYIHYGVREHAMGAIMNGLALHGGFIPYAGTFLVFSDYMRPAIRMAAMMGVRVIHVLTHDSIGLGEDGPTHQPVETLASLRAIPGLAVYRPADAVETSECWDLALTSTAGPAAISLSRQAVPTVRAEIGENLCARGGYVLAEAEGGARRVTLIATGTEVAIALAARDILQKEGVPTAVVSLPCWELFDAQPEGYRRQVLAPDTVRVAVEAAIDQGWHRYIGENGVFIGMHGFGKSGPYKKLFEHFGITPEKVAAAAKAKL